MRTADPPWCAGALRIALGAALLLDAPACDGTARATSAVAVTDSAGIEIVTIPAPDTLAGAWTADSVPSLELGHAMGDEATLLHDVVGAARLRDGRVLVANGGSKELRLFAADGTLSATWGGEGEGPGEFRDLSFFALLRDDSVLTFDRSLQRATVFDAHGMVAGVWHTAVPNAPILQDVVGVTAAGQLVMSAFAGEDPVVPGPYTTPQVIGLFDRGAGRYSVIDTISGSELAQVERDGRLMAVVRPFGRKSDVVASEDFIFAIDAGADVRVRVYSGRGDLVRLLHIQAPATRVDGRLVEDWIEGFIAQYSTGAPALEAMWRFGFERTAPPAFVPMFRALEVDAGGSICGERYPLTETAAPVYRCFAPDGRFERSIALPAGIRRAGNPNLEPRMEIGSDYVLGVWTDELGVQRVRMYRLRS